jgi:hypothetical protein
MDATDAIDATDPTRRATPQGEQWSAAAGGGPPGGFDGSFGGGGGYGAPPPPPGPAPPPPPPFGAPPQAPFGYGGGGMGGGYGPSPQVHQLANVSLACAVASLPMSCCCHFVSAPLAIAGIVCGILGLTRIKAQPQVYEGTTHCIAGIIIGAAGLVFFVLALVLGFGMQILKLLGKH